MSEFATQTAAQMLAACQQGADAAAAALQRAWESPVECHFADAESLDMSKFSQSLHGPALTLRFASQKDCAIAVFPSAEGVTPEWCAQPNEAGKTKLDALATEFGKAILPQVAASCDSQAQYVEDLAKFMSPLAGTDLLHGISGSLTVDGKDGVFQLIWPVPIPADRAREPHGGTDRSPPPATRESSRIADLNQDLRQLPPYARSLLKVQVPVTVTLAEVRLPVKQITELAPGAVIQFKKSCDDPLKLEIGNRKIAEGEAVKVDEKFGLWITSIAMPEERFWVVSGNHERVK